MSDFDDFDLDLNDDLDFDLDLEEEEDILDFDLGENEDFLDFDEEEEDDDFLALDFSLTQELLEKPTTVELARLVRMACKCKDQPANHPKIGEAATSPTKTITLKEEMEHWFGMHERKPAQPVYRTQAATCAYQLLAGCRYRTVCIPDKDWSVQAFVQEYKPESDIVRVVFKLPERYLKMANVNNLDDHYTGWFNNQNGRPASDSKTPFRLN